MTLFYNQLNLLLLKIKMICQTMLNKIDIHCNQNYVNNKCIKISFLF